MSLNVRDNKLNISANYSMLPLYFALICLPFLVVGETIQIDKLVSFGVYGVMLSAAVCFVSILQKSRKASLLYLLILSSSVMMVFSRSLSADSVVSLLCFLELPIFIVYIHTFEVSRAFVKNTILLFYLLSWYYLILSLSDIAYLSGYGDNALEDLTLGLSNPNQTGIFLMVNLIVLVSGVFFFDKLFVKVAFLLNALIIFWLIILTNSRSCLLIGILLFTFLLFAKKIRFSSFSCFLAVMIPVLFIIISYWLSETGKMVSLFGEMFETGRLYIFRTFFNSISFFDFMVGDFEYLFNNMHNLYVTILSTAGIVVLLIYVALLYFSLKYIVNRSGQLFNRIAYFGMLLIVVHSSAESALFVGGSYYTMFVFAIYCIASCNNSSQKIKRKGE